MARDSRSVRFQEFRAEADLLLPKLGPARVSHPEEFERILEHLEKASVELVIRSKCLAYSPATGQPGRMILDEEFSIAAIRHEYRHFLDHHAMGYPGLRPFLEDFRLFARFEVRGYLEEIRTAREMKHGESVKKIIEQMKSRVRELLGDTR